MTCTRMSRAGLTRRASAATSGCTVVGVGSDVRVVGTGDRVTGGLAPGCGRCAECRADLGAYCSTARSYYIGANAPASGGFAPFMAASADRLVRVPDELTDDDAAVIEPVSVALHAVRRSRMRAGDVVCVVGCGPIGLLVAQCARLAGAGKVIAVEPDADRRRLALDTGADVAVEPGAQMREAVNEATDGLRADIAFDCAGIPQTIQQSVGMVRYGGSVCIVGVTGSDATIRPNEPACPASFAGKRRGHRRTLRADLHEPDRGPDELGA